ncbi:MAG: hypothetical protein JJT96_20865 [Opitutales bacterium]|nr:hypothetical protein [Opitutales bacterium]
MASSITARVHHPDTPIIWLCPQELPHALTLMVSQVIGGDFRVIVCNTERDEPAFQSRWLKIDLSEIIADQCFVYLDSDILVKGKLTGLFSTGKALSACRNVDAPNGQDSGWHNKAFFNPLGWTVPPRPLVNSGVMVYSKAYDFSIFRSRWKELWSEQVRILGKFQDQPALNLAKEVLGADFGLLPDTYNNQLLHYTNVRLDARVHHFLGTEVSPIVRALSPFIERDPQKIETERFVRKYRKLARRAYPFQATPRGIALLVKERRFRWLIQLLSRGRCFCRRGPTTQMEMRSG